MMLKNKAEKDIKKMWALIQKDSEALGYYLSTGKFMDGVNEQDIFMMMVVCLKIVVGELYVNTEKYEKYPAKHYTEDEFVNMVIDSIGKKLPDKNDFDGTIAHIKSIKSLMWGYAKYNCENYLKLYMAFNQHDTGNCTFGHLKSCAAIVLVECILRRTQKNRNICL
jgi:hypothetical protein